MYCLFNINTSIGPCYISWSIPCIRTVLSFETVISILEAECRYVFANSTAAVYLKIPCLLVSGCQSDSAASSSLYQHTALSALSVVEN